jgi:hypothetical protein
MSHRGIGKTGNNVPQRHRKNRQQCPSEASEKQATMSHRGIRKTGNKCPTEASKKQATMSHRGIGKTGNNVPQRHRKNRQQCPTEASEKQAKLIPLTLIYMTYYITDLLQTLQ